MLQYDTVWDAGHNNYQIKKTVFKTFPEKEHPTPDMVSNDSVIVKTAPYVTNIMSGAILLGFNTTQIIKSKQKIREASLIVMVQFFLLVY